MQSTSLMHGHASCMCKQSAISIVQDGDYEWTQVVSLLRLTIVVTSNRLVKD